MIEKIYVVSYNLMLYICCNDLMLSSLLNQYAGAVMMKRYFTDFMFLRIVHFTNYIYFSL